MSLFLGPVHFWLYDKIKNQEALTSLIAEHFGKGAEYTKQLPPLEEVIDEGNIHGWLQSQITDAETRYASLVSVILNENENALDEIKKGDIVISKAGDKIAVDGEIIEGSSHFDESFITGESKPVAKAKGEKVIAGSLNFDGFIKYKAERIGKESTVSEIVKLVIEASNTKAPIAKIADKISGIFVPSVIVIAIVTFFAYLILGYDTGTALSTFITVLVVACPCSLGLATPLAIVVSEGVCAENGILVKKSEILENASKIDTIVFDKTGTLTYGKLKISKIYNYI